MWSEAVGLRFDAVCGQLLRSLLFLLRCSFDGHMSFSFLATASGWIFCARGDLARIRRRPTEFLRYFRSSLVDSTTSEVRLTLGLISHSWWFTTEVHFLELWLSLHMASLVRRGATILPHSCLWVHPDCRKPSRSLLQTRLNWVIGWNEFESVRYSTGGGWSSISLLEHTGYVPVPAVEVFCYHTKSHGVPGTVHSHPAIPDLDNPDTSLIRMNFYEF